ncbi:hypothetical protein, partial [Streptomyces sp. WAC06614]|uniref:hypothetical protein n=1 Tax=Streptomyces sp. WAC06614 TaxID=2487416 RepID=UPI000F7AD8BC
MISAGFTTSPTDVTVCEACWKDPVQAVRTTPLAPHRDLLCTSCAAQGHPVRVELFPPLGVYRLTRTRVSRGKHRNPGHPEP